MRTHKTVLVLIASLLLICLSSASLTWGNQNKAFQSDLPGTIDGASDPASIPDAVA